MVAGMLAFATLFGIILLSLKTQSGEVIVQIPEDLPAEIRKEIKISVTGDGAAEVASEANGWKVGVKEGKYSVELTGGGDLLQIEEEQVTVSRNKNAIVTITLKPLDAVPAKNRGKPADTHRQFAEWLKSLPPPLTFDVVLADGSYYRVGPEQSLPERLLAVQDIFLQWPTEIRRQPCWQFVLVGCVEPVALGQSPDASS